MFKKALKFEERKRLFTKWERQKTLLRAEFIGLSAGLTFTGHLSEPKGVELRLTRGKDSLSLSLLGAEINYMEITEATPTPDEYFESSEIALLQIVLDSGASCTLYEVFDDGSFLTS
jgi:hypothetical protein